MTGQPSDEFFAALVDFRFQVHQEHTRAQDRGEAILLRALDEGRRKMSHTEDVEFRGHMEFMRSLGVELRNLDAWVKTLTEDNPT